MGCTPSATAAACCSNRWLHRQAMDRDLGDKRSYWYNAQQVDGMPDNEAYFDVGENNVQPRS